MKTFAGLAAAVFLAVGAAACGGGGSETIARVGSQPITKKQLDAVLRYDRTQYPRLNLPFPRPGSAEYLLLRQQALDYLVEQSRAHQADAKIGVPPQDSVVSDAAFRKVTANVHGPDNDPEGLTLEQRRAAVMHGFVAAARRDYPVTYARGYEPVPAAALARKVFVTHRARRLCNLPPGTYPMPTAVEHGCAEPSGPIGGGNVDPCSIVEPPGDSGFTSAEENDGFAEYAMDNGRSCAGDPRAAEIVLTAEDNRTPVAVSYLHRAGTAVLEDDRYGISLRYPRRLHTFRIRYEGITGGRSDGIEISNFALEAPSFRRTLPQNGVDVAILAAVSGLDIYPAPRDSAFPVSAAGRVLRGRTTTIPIQADGDRYSIVIREGSRPSAQDQAAVRELVTSIRFRPSRPGTFVASGLYVLGRASGYPLGSVTRIPGGVKLPNAPNPGQVLRSRPFYLVHAKDEFLELAWPRRSLCGVRYDAAHRLFRCRDGSAYTLRGQPVRNQYSADSEYQPYVSPAPVSFDGYVLANVSATN